MKETDPKLRLEVQGDRIVISLPGTKFRVVYRKREHASWSWLIASDYDRDDSKDPISRADFLARAWKLAHDKARELGWIGTSFIPRKSEMKEDERELFEQMVSLVQGRDIDLASNATMNLLANLIVTVSPSLEQAVLGVQYAAQNLEAIVRAMWQDQGEPHPQVS
jgi:hypothetical protein